jgi:7,8-dihydroneopterin aldolase/epimerase/oxygenase
MDSILICDLSVLFHVGVTEVERANAQRLLLTVEMLHNVAQAAAQDDLRLTLDYFAVSQRLLGMGEGRSWKLIETLAVDIAFLVLREFKAEAVTAEVKKFIIREAEYVAVRVTRTRADVAASLG